MSLQLVAQGLYTDGVLDVRRAKQEPITLASGRTSRFKLDCERMSPNTFEIVVRLLCEEFEDELLAADFITGVPKGGMVLAEAIANRMNKPLVRVKKVVLESGKKTFAIDDDLGGYKNGVLIEDVVSTGGSARKVYDLFAPIGVTISHTLAFIDREQQGKKVFAREGHTYRFLVSARGLFAYFFYNMKCIDEKEYWLLLKELGHT